MKNELTQKELKKNLRYNPKTGIFKWKISPNRNIKIDKFAGCNKGGYISICVNSLVYGAHRLAWLYVKGYLPEHIIDHIDRNPSNNKWNNLRHVTQRCNMINTGLLKNNKSGIKGVCWANHANKWYAQIMVNNKSIYLGIYKGFTKAVYHRWKAEVKYDFPNCNSTSSAYLYLKKKGLIK